LLRDATASLSQSAMSASALLHAFVLPVSFKESTDGLMLGLVLDTIEARACRVPYLACRLAWLRQNVDAFNRLFGQRGELHRRRRFARTRERMLVSGNCMGFFRSATSGRSWIWKLVRWRGAAGLETRTG